MGSEATDGGWRLRQQWPLVALVVLLAWFVEESQVFQVTILAAGLAVLWWPYSESRSSTANSRKRDLVLLGLAIAVLVVGVRDDLKRFLLDGGIRGSNVYHYYLGSKYFSELGYTDLYVATLAADLERHGYWDEEISEVRDLATYEIVSLDRAVSGYRPEERFSPERWRSFGDDVEALSAQRRPERWRNVFRDRGYNGTPLWTAMGRAVTRLVPATPVGLPLLAALDLLLLGATGWLVAVTFGWRRATLVLLLFAASPTNISRLIGGFLQTDWLCAIAASLCFQRRRKPWPAGALMAYAAMTRGFPFLLVASAAVPAIRQWLRDKRLPERFARYAASFFLFCLVGVALGAANGRGLVAWVEWFDAIGLHSEQHVLGERRVGLEHAFTIDLSDQWETGEENDRASLLDSRQPLVVATRLTMLGLLVLAAAPRRAWDAQLLGLAAVFTLLVVSRYYFGVAALLPLLGGGGAFRRRVVVGGQVAAFLAVALATLAGAGWHASYALLNLLLAIYFAVILVVPGLQDASLRTRLTARDTGRSSFRPRCVSESEHGP